MIPMVELLTDAPVKDKLEDPVQVGDWLAIARVNNDKPFIAIGQVVGFQRKLGNRPGYWIKMAWYRSNIEDSYVDSDQPDKFVVMSRPS